MFVDRFKMFVTRLSSHRSTLTALTSRQRVSGNRFVSVRMRRFQDQQRRYIDWLLLVLGYSDPAVRQQIYGRPNMLSGFLDHLLLAVFARLARLIRHPRLATQSRLALLSRREKWIQAINETRSSISRFEHAPWTYRMLSDVYRWSGESDASRRYLYLSRQPKPYRELNRYDTHPPVQSPLLADFEDFLRAQRAIRCPTQVTRLCQPLELVSARWPISPARDFIQTSPHFLATNVEQAADPIEEQSLSGYLVEGASVRALSNEIRVGDRTLFPRGRNRYHLQHPVNMPGLQVAWENLNLIKAGGLTSAVEAGVFAGGTWAGNWYHWCIEIMPRLLFLDRQVPADIPLLVPIRNVQRQNFLGLLRLVCPDRPIVPISEDSEYRVNHLYTMDSPTTLVSNAVGRPFPRPGSHVIHAASLLALRETLQGAIRNTTLDDGLPKRIYLDRRGHNSRQFNERAVRRCAVRHGFTPVDPSQLDVLDQLRIFSTAKAVLGPSGAAWTLSLVAREPFVGLIWGAEPNLGTLSIWSNIMKPAAAKLYAMGIPSPALDSPDVHRMKYFVDPASLDEILNDLSKSS